MYILGKNDQQFNSYYMGIVRESLIKGSLYFSQNIRINGVEYKLVDLLSLELVNYRIEFKHKVLVKYLVYNLNYRFIVNIILYYKENIDSYYMNYRRLYNEFVTIR